MSGEIRWECFIAYPDEASAVAVAQYLRLHECPAFVFARAPDFDLAPPFEVRVPGELLHRARWLWSLADARLELTDGELEYLATGRLPGTASEPRWHDDAA